MPKDNTPLFTVSTGPLPASRKVHAPGRLFPGLRVALREIDLEPGCGEAPVRVYDSSGPYSDPAADIDIERGLPALRAGWIEARQRAGPRLRGASAVARLGGQETPRWRAPRR